MTDMGLSPNSTIRDVLPTLKNPEEFVREVLAHLMECQRTHPDCEPRVSIGITGEGKVPYHKIIYGDDGQVFAAYQVRRPIPADALRQSTWSSASLSVADVRAILGEIRNLPRRSGRPAVPSQHRRARVNRLLRQADEAMRTGGQGIDLARLSDGEFRQWLEEATAPDRPPLNQGNAVMKTYRVRWEIDIEAESPLEAAEEAFRLVRKPDTTATVFDILDYDKGTKITKITKIDLLRGKV